MFILTSPVYYLSEFDINKEQLHEKLVRKAHNVRAMKGVGNDVIATAKSILRMYCIPEGDSPDMPDKNEVMEDMRSILPRKSLFTTKEFFLAPMFLLILLHDVSKL